MAERKSLESIIKNNTYIKSCSSRKSTKGRDSSSLSFLVSKNLTQSQCIKLGIAVEDTIRDVILEYNKNLTDIVPKNKRGAKERDYLFKDDTTKTIYYAEMKCNLNLDTEKCKSTSLKCIQIKEELEKQYPDYVVKMYLIGSRYRVKEMIPKTILGRFSLITENIIGIDDYLSELNTKFSFETEKKYQEFLDTIVCNAFNNS